MTATLLLTESSVPSDTDKTCPECGRTEPRSIWRKRHWGKVCNPCLRKRLRAENGATAENDREASRRWKAENRERNRARDREFGKRKRKASDA